MEPRESRGWRPAAPLALLLAGVCAGWMAACRTAPRSPALDPDDSRQRARPVSLGKWYNDSLDCDGDADCADWKQFRVEDGGELRIQVFTPTGEGLPDFRMRLEDDGGRVLERVPASGRSPREIRRSVSSGRYYLLVEAEDAGEEPERAGLFGRGGGGDGARVDYDLLVRFARKEPRCWEECTEDCETAEVLEVEPNPREPTHAVIDKGRPHGVTKRLEGELVDAGDPIGAIRVVEVYESGSRVEILGALSGPVTFDTRARFCTRQCRQVCSPE